MDSATIRHPGESVSRSSRCGRDDTARWHEPPRGATRYPQGVATKRDRVGTRGRCQSQQLSVVFPLVFQLRDQGNEARVLSQVIQIRIILKHLDNKGSRRLPPLGAS